MTCAGYSTAMATVSWGVLFWTEVTLYKHKYFLLSFYFIKKEENKLNPLAANEGICFQLLKTIYSLTHRKFM